MIAKGLDLVDRGDVFRTRWNATLGGLFFAMAAASVWLAGRAFFPASDPRQHVDLKSERTPEFFVTGLQDAPWWSPFWTAGSHHRLARTHEEYFDSLKGATKERLMIIVSGELLKVSVIRETKLLRLKWLTYLGLVTAVLFVCLSISARRNTASADTPPPSMTVINQQSGGVVDELSTGCHNAVGGTKTAPRGDP